MGLEHAARLDSNLVLGMNGQADQASTRQHFRRSAKSKPAPSHLANSTCRTSAFTSHRSRGKKRVDKAQSSNSLRSAVQTLESLFGKYALSVPALLSLLPALLSVWSTPGYATWLRRRSRRQPSLSLLLSYSPHLPTCYSRTVYRTSVYGGQVLTSSCS